MEEEKLREDKISTHSPKSKSLTSTNLIPERISPDSVFYRVSDSNNKPSHKTDQEETLALCKKYTSDGMLFNDALIKALYEVRKSKDTPLERELRMLGCVQWGEIAEITQGILDDVKVFHNPARGAFVLKPGLRLVYIK